jgi:hypothetical protein
MSDSPDDQVSRVTRLTRVPLSDDDRARITWHLQKRTWWRTSPIAAFAGSVLTGQILGMLIGILPMGLMVLGTAIFDPGLGWMKRYRIVPFVVGYVVPTTFVTWRVARSSLREQRSMAVETEQLRQDLVSGEKEIVEFRATRAVRIDNEYRIRTYLLDDEAGTRYFLADGAWNNQPEIGSEIRVVRLPISRWTLNWTAAGEPVPVLMRCFCHHDEQEIPYPDRPAEIGWDAFVEQWLPHKDRPIEFDENEFPDEDAENPPEQPDLAREKPQAGP